MSSYSLGQMSNANAVQTLVNGDEIFPSMLQAIGAARSTIDFGTYIYWSGAVGYEFAHAIMIAIAMTHLTYFPPWYRGTSTAILRPTPPSSSNLCFGTKRTLLASAIKPRRK